MSPAIRSLFCVLIAAGCASGGNSGGNDAPPPKIDAPTTHRDASSVTNDAKIYLDAHAPPDATVFLDAPPVLHDASTSGGTCSLNSDCTTTGQCCYVIVCVHGTAVGNALCFPQ